ncbi:alpha/beta hydrolase family protein [Massilia horti]|uniref:Alpha/beta fold hydrolase n=1 Tax=Massilia horti TaxID=2562153 RepID=A0A4Y9T954_9BURK|nr:alpha/beta fold hydrolase [Massilia horti]TFW35573.1 alpha/beta fold hydrolase [Massilia horti]
MKRTYILETLQLNTSHLRVLALLALLVLQPVTQAGPLQDHPGYWLGDMTLPNGRVLKIGAELFTRADGSAWASIASPDQGVYDVPVKTIQAEPGNTLVLDADVARLKLTWVQDHFQGEWTQGETPLLLELRQVDAFPMRSRPQTPQPPFPYKEEMLAIRSKDGVTLGATLTVPRAPARPNVVVLVAGSGPQTRHVNVSGHRKFDVLADHLARQGVAVLRYDKRGVARSTGDYYGHTLADLENDLAAAVQALAARKEFGRIGLVGHSEGSQIAAAVAARHPEAVDFIVSMAGVGLSGFDVMLLQDRQEAKDNGASPEEVERIMPYVRKYYETVLATPDGAPRIAALKAVYAALPPELQGLITKYKMNRWTLSPEFAANPSLRVLLASNPQRDWRKVRCPVLVLNGTLDHQVPAEENVAGILAALKEGGNTRGQSELLPSVNHPFQTAHTGAPDEYTKIDETMAPTVLQKVADFARKQP